MFEIADEIADELAQTIQVLHEKLAARDKLIGDAELRGLQDEIAAADREINEKYGIDEIGGW